MDAEDEYVGIAFDRHARGKCWDEKCAFCFCEKQERKRIMKDLKRLLKMWKKNVKKNCDGECNCPDCKVKI